MNPIDLLAKIKELWPIQFAIAALALAIENEQHIIDIKKYFGCNDPKKFELMKN